MTREIRGLELLSEELLTRFYEDRGIKSNGGGFMASRLLITSCYSGEQSQLEALDRVTSVAEDFQVLASPNSVTIFCSSSLFTTPEYRQTL